MRALEDRTRIGVALPFAWRPSGLVVVDEGVDARSGFERATSMPIRPRNCAAGQPLVRLAPGLAGIGGLPDSTFRVARLSARIAPFAPDALPHRRIERVRVGRIHDEIDRARCAGCDRATFFHVRPPSVVLNTPRISLSVHSWPEAATYTTSGFDGVDDDAGDRLSVGEPGVGEGSCAVGGLVDADAGHRRAEQVCLARADPHDVRVRWARRRRRRCSSTA